MIENWRVTQEVQPVSGREYTNRWIPRGTMVPNTSNTVHAYLWADVIRIQFIPEGAGQPVWFDENRHTVYHQRSLEPMEGFSL